MQALGVSTANGLLKQLESSSTGAVSDRDSSMR